MIKLEVPHLTYGELGIRSEQFLRQYDAWNAIPVPIEKIVEIQMGIDVIPLPRLKRDVEIDAFISSDFTSITVDEEIFDRYPNRYRFSLAHEAAHAVLHRDIFAPYSFNTVVKYKNFLSQLRDDDINWIEWQAYCFAGLVLVPAPQLEAKFVDAKAMADQAGISVVDHWDVAIGYIASNLADCFKVSDQVIEKRINYDKLRERFGRL
jgi:hypothetical protein